MSCNEHMNNENQKELKADTFVNVWRLYCSERRQYLKTFELSRMFSITVFYSVVEYEKHFKDASLYYQDKLRINK